MWNPIRASALDLIQSFWHLKVFYLSNLCQMCRRTEVFFWLSVHLLCSHAAFLDVPLSGRCRGESKIRWESDFLSLVCGSPGSAGSAGSQTCLRLAVSCVSHTDSNYLQRSAAPTALRQNVFFCTWRRYMGEHQHLEVWTSGTSVRHHALSKWKCNGCLNCRVKIIIYCDTRYNPRPHFIYFQHEKNKQTTVLSWKLLLQVEI